RLGATLVSIGQQGRGAGESLVLIGPRVAGDAGFARSLPVLVASVRENSGGCAEVDVLVEDAIAGDDLLIFSREDRAQPRQLAIERQADLPHRRQLEVRIDRV